MYKTIGKFWYITQSANRDIFIKHLEESTFAFAHLFLQISDSHIPVVVYWMEPVSHVKFSQLQTQC